MSALPPKADITESNRNATVLLANGLGNNSLERGFVTEITAVCKTIIASFKNEATKWNTDRRTASANKADDRNELQSVDRRVGA